MATIRVSNSGELRVQQGTVEVGAPPTVWDINDKSAGMVISGANSEIASESGSNYESVRSLTTHTSGKHYFELRPATGGADFLYGLRFKSDILGSGPSGSWVHNTAALYRGNAGYFALGTTAVGGGVVAINPNDVCMGAVDFGTLEFWVGVNGVWNGSGDPGAGTNPAFTLVAGTWAIVYHSDNIGSSDMVQANFGQAPFVYTVPAGFSAGF